jgi:uncharacterized protein YdaU (DUF1376 family)
VSAAPFMQLYVADYLGDTRHLSTEQHGAYLLLLMAMWRAGGSLPDDETKLARIVGLSPAKWRRVSADVLAFFTVADGVLTQKRLTAEIEKTKEKSIKRADAGSKGGQAKALKTKKPAVANATILPQHLSDIRDQKEESKNSVASATGADAPSIDPKTILFRQGLPLLASLTGKPEGVLRPILGRWLKLTGNDCGAVLAEIERCRGSPVANPVSWIEARLKPKAPHEQPRSGRDKAFAALAAYVGEAEGVDEFRWNGDAPRRDDPDDGPAGGTMAMRPVLAAVAGRRL